MNTHILLRRVAVIATVAILCTTGAVAGTPRSMVAGPSAAADGRTKAAAPDAARLASTLPMAFEPNVGQTDGRVSFLARGRNYGVFVTPEHITLSLGTGSRREAVRMRFVGAREDARVSPEGRLPGVSNYLVGRDSSTWHRDVPTYESVRYANVYDGVDARFYGSQRSLEYDLEVAPGADPSRVRVRFEGQTAVTANEDGSLRLKLAGGEIVQQRAIVYQQSGTMKRSVSAKYVVRGSGEVGFEIGEYDRTAPLVIDPALVYADYLGGGVSDDAATSVAVDASGNAYVVGTTNAADFPTTPGAYDSSFGDIGNYYYSSYGDAFVTELNASGTAAIYSTYLGGSSHDAAHDLAVDTSGAAYVVGETSSVDFPITPGAFDPVGQNLPSNSEGFVTKLAPGGGSLAYSSFIGGFLPDTVESVALDAQGRATVAGETYSYDFPTTAGAFDPTFNSNGNSRDAFVARVAASGTSLDYSTFVGGYGDDAGTAVAVGANGAAYLTGTTQSTPDFPVTAGAYDTTFTGYTDAYLVELAPDGASLVYATYLGGDSEDTGYSVAVDAAGNAFVAGSTYSDDYPVTAGTYTTGVGYGTDCFLTKVAPGGASLVFSSRFGGSSNDQVSGVALDGQGVAYLAGTTSSSDFPTTAGAYDTSVDGNYDAFALKFDAAGTALAYSTYLGGSGEDHGDALAVSASQQVTVVGYATSPDFPTTAGAFSAHYAGMRDGFVTKLDATGATLAYSTFLSGTATPYGSVYDAANAVAVDSAGNAYVAGATASPNYPTTPGAYDTTTNNTGAPYYGYTDAYVSKVSADGTELIYSTFLGGEFGDAAYAIAVDATGRAYVGGGTSSATFPVTAGAFDATFDGGYNSDVSSEGFVTKLAADGASLVYSSYLGGLGSDEVRGIAIDGSGAAYATGRTYSADFPTTVGAYDTTYGGYSNGDAFAVKILSSGTALAYGTYVGGSGDDAGSAIAIDASGAAYVVGRTGSPNFPTTPGALDTTYNGYLNNPNDAFVAKVAPSGASLAFSTYLGGESYDEANGVAVDAAGAVYVAGSTSSADFPVTPGAYDTSNDGYFSPDGYVAKLVPSGASLAYATYVGGFNTDTFSAIAVDASGDAFVTGTTDSSNYPTTPGAYDRTLSFADAVVTELDPAGAALVYSTFLGGEQYETGTALAYAGGSHVVVAGTTSSQDFAESGFGGRDMDNGFVASLDLMAGPLGGDSPGVYVPSSGAWFLRNDITPGSADLTFVYGAGGAGLVPLRGDWNGDGVDTVGVYQPSTGTFFLKNSNEPGNADYVFTLGAGGAGVVPVSGDWNGDGIDTVGIYVSASGTFFLIDWNVSGPANYAFTYGGGGGAFVPVTGDWNHDGVDTIGIYHPATGTFFLRESNDPGPADHTFTFGPPGLVPITGDWNNDGFDTVGVYVPSSGAWFLRNVLAPGPADVSFVYGPPNATPLAGNWDGQ